MEKYPTHAVNGVVYVSKVTDPATKEIKEVEDPSYVVEIPKPKASLLAPAGAEPRLHRAPPTPATQRRAAGEAQVAGR